MNRNWNEICAWILSEIKSLPYIPGLRWSFYQVLEKFSLSKDDWVGFKSAVARRRKGFKDGWKPDTLADTIRYPLWAGLGPASWSRFRKSTLDNLPREGVWTSGDLPFYAEIWYEAEAMTGQFQTYVQTPWRIPMRPFRGDYTIAPKWDVAQWLRQFTDRGTRVKIIYFGDADDKGEQIPYSALKDVLKWIGPSRNLVDFHVGGLHREQAIDLELQQNFERPGQWQWEALSNDQARKIITEALEETLDMPALQSAIERSDFRREMWADRVRESLPEEE